MFSDWSSVRLAALSRFPSESRRGSSRYPCRTDGSIFVSVSDGHQSRWAQADDVSREGIALLVCCAFVPGAALTISLRGGPHQATFVRGADVVYAEPRQEGQWRVGCRFETPLRVDELQALV